jgi:hypothetical protein
MGHIGLREESVAVHHAEWMSRVGFLLIAVLGSVYYSLVGFEAK